ncbi:hypothetical protein BH23VER1_BH23VER1_20790 [soil metagenome]
MPEPDLSELESLLRRRLEVIGDSAWRERDPDGQLAELTRVGTALLAQHAALQGQIPARLDHFLTRCSYDKALAFVAGTESAPGEG